MLSQRIVQEAQRYMGRDGGGGLHGWLIHDYRRSNPIFWQVSGEGIGTVTRPCFLFIPVTGESKVLAHHVDAGKFREAGIGFPGMGTLAVYKDRQAMVEALGDLLPSGARVAMEYSPMGAMPRASKVDAGTVELVRSLGVEVVSSADLLQYSTQRWGPAQLESHQRSADKLGRIVLDAFDYIGQSLGPTEYQVAQFIRARFQDEGLHSPDGPIVAVNGHASDPHYEPQREGSSVVAPGDWVLIDLWARSTSEGRQGDSVYADITWVAYVGEEVPQRHEEVFRVVAGARDAALAYLQRCHSQGTTPLGWQVDRAAREYISSRDYGQYFTHRLGHSISTEVHGDAVNLDGFETEDSRGIIPGICFSIEPGIYLPDFGVRSEIDVYMSEEGPYATTPIQRDVVLIRP